MSVGGTYRVFSEQRLRTTSTIRHQEDLCYTQVHGQIQCGCGCGCGCRCEKSQSPDLVSLFFDSGLSQKEKEVARKREDRVETWWETGSEYGGKEANRFRTLGEIVTSLQKEQVAEAAKVESHMLDLQLQDPLDGGHPVPHPVNNCPPLVSSRSFVNLRLSSERYRNKFNRKLKIDGNMRNNSQTRHQTFPKFFYFIFSSETWNKCGI